MSDRPRINTGQWIIVFGTAAQVINVIPSRAFPRYALDVLICTVGGVTTTLTVPDDYQPMLIEGAYTPPPSNGAILPQRAS